MTSDHDIFARNVPGTTEVLRGTHVGIAGAGGLGSNVAVALARAGVGRLTFVDMDVVEASNLNRQHYFLGDLGTPKVEALSKHLKAIDPSLELVVTNVELTADDVVPTFGTCDVLVEAFDRAEAKRWLIDAWCRAFPTRPLVAASGISGVGMTESIKVTRAGPHLTFVGDLTTSMEEGLSGPRVMLAAAMQANLVIEHLLKGAQG